MKVKPSAVGKRSYNGKDGSVHTEWIVVVQDGSTLVGFSQRDGQAPQVGVEVEVSLDQAFEIRKPWVPRQTQAAA